MAMGLRLPMPVLEAKAMEAAGLGKMVKQGMVELQEGTATIRDKMRKDLLAFDCPISIGFELQMVVERTHAFGGFC